MTTRTIQKGEIGCDYAGQQGYRPDLFKQFGVTFVTRYISTTTTSWKVLTVAERDKLFAAGVAITLVWETSVSAIDGGAAQGHADGKLAVLRASELKYPSNCAIQIAVDTDVYSKNLANAEAYIRAFDAELRGHYVTGLYGDKDCFVACSDIIKFWCIPNAMGWSPGPIPALVNLKQGHENSVTDWDYPNTCLIPFEAWTGLGAAPTPGPAPKPDPVPVPVPPATPVNSGTMNVIFQLADANAQFIGPAFLNSRGQWVATLVEWTGDGNDPRVQARMKKLIDAGVPVAPGASVDGMSTTSLIGPLPTGDDKHVWTGKEFFHHYPGGFQA